MKLRWLTIILGATALLTTACGDASTATTVPPPTSPQPSPTADSGASDDETRFLPLLSMVPDLPVSRSSVAITDVAALRAAFNLQRPAPDATTTETEEYLISLMRAARERDSRIITPGRWLAGFNRQYPAFSTYPYMGFDRRSVNAVAEYGDDTPASIEILLGDYDSEVTSARLAECEECVEADIQQHAGETFYSWGGDFDQNLRQRLSPPAFDNLGRGGRIWVGDGVAARTLSTENMHALLDAAADTRPRLADDEDYRLAAQTLSEEGTVTGIFSSTGFSAAELVEEFTAYYAAGSSPLATPEEIEEQLTQGPLLLPFSVIATGIGFDGQQGFTTLVLVQETPEVATENALRLRERIETTVVPMSHIRGRDEKGEPILWKDFLEEYEIESDGRTVILRLPEDAGLDWMLNRFAQSDEDLRPLTIHE